MLALPGCPPNATVKSFLEGIGTGQTFGFLEYAIVGAPVCVIMIVYYLTIGQKIIPKNKELVKKAKMDPNAVYKAKDEKVQELCISYLSNMISLGFSKKEATDFLVGYSSKLKEPNK